MFMSLRQGHTGSLVRRKCMVQSSWLSKPSDPRSMVRMRSPSSCEKSNDSKLWIYPQSKSFWKHPDIPGDLLNEPQPTVPNTGSLHDDAIARTYAIRTQESSVRITR